MARIKSYLAGFLRDESGTETLEWGLVCGLLVVGAIIALTAIGPKMKEMWNDVSTEVKTASETAKQ